MIEVAGQCAGCLDFFGVELQAVNDPVRAQVRAVALDGPHYYRVAPAARLEWQRKTLYHRCRLSAPVRLFGAAG